MLCSESTTNPGQPARPGPPSGDRVQDSAAHQLLDMPPMTTTPASLREQIESIPDPVERRTFLKLMGASMALAGAAACTRQPAEHIVPYVRQPEEMVPGRPLFFA